MKNVLLFTTFLMLVASMAFAQSGGIAVYADKYGACCDLYNHHNSMQVYFIHEYTPGATASQFAVQVQGVPLTNVGETVTPPFQSFGHSSYGIAIAYGACLTSPIHVLTITYLGTSAPCDMIRVVEDPSATPPGIYVTDCAEPIPHLLTGIGGATYINNDGTCNCSLSPCPPEVPVEKNSWGKVKALYR
jgi:hypothetical protein